MGILNRIGIGSAEVDTVLERERVQPGDSVPAHIEIEGGSEDQTVDDIELAVMTRYEVETDEGSTYRNVAIRETELTDGFTIEEGEERTMDAGTIDVPLSTPPTLGRTKVWVHTGLDIDWSVDPTDEDVLEVEPGPYLATLLDAVEGLGFRRHSVDTVHGSGFGPQEFVQEFEYRPTADSRYYRELDEIELFPVRRGDALEVVVEVDKRGGSLFGSDESKHRVTVETTDVEQTKQQVGDLIDRQL